MQVELLFLTLRKTGGWRGLGASQHFPNKHLLSQLEQQATEFMPIGALLIFCCGDWPLHWLFMVASMGEADIQAFGRNYFRTGILRNPS